MARRKNRVTLAFVTDILEVARVQVGITSHHIQARQGLPTDFSFPAAAFDFPSVQVVGAGRVTRISVSPIFVTNIEPGKRSRQFSIEKITLDTYFIFPTNE